MNAAWLVVVVFFVLLGYRGHLWVEADRFRAAATSLRTDVLVAGAEHPELVRHPRWRELNAQLSHTSEHGPISLWVHIWESWRLPSVPSLPEGPRLEPRVAETLSALWDFNGRNLMHYYAVHNPILTLAVLGPTLRNLRHTNLSVFNMRLASKPTEQGRP